MARDRNFVYQFGPFLFDPTNRRLIHHKFLLDSSVTTLQVLGVLIENAGEVVTRQDLAQTVWPHTTIDSEEVDSHVANLKRLLHDNKENPYVRRISNQGYRFEGKVTELLASSISDEIGGQGPDFPYRSYDREEEIAQKSLRNPSAKLTPVLVVAVVAALCFWGWHSTHESSHGSNVQASAGADNESGETASVPKLPQQIAVLPLASLGGSPDDVLFVSGLTEAIIGALSKNSPLKVLSSATVRRYAKSGVSDPISAGRESGARTVVVGMAQRMAGRAHVSVQMLNAQDGSKIWSGAFDGGAEDIAGLSAQISQKIGKRVPSSETGQ